MASAQMDRESYPVFVFDTRRPIDGYVFGILGRFWITIVIHADEYIKHLNCDVLTYRNYGGETQFVPLHDLARPDCFSLLLWKCTECGEYRFCHLWIKKVEYTDEEYSIRILMAPILNEYSSEIWQEILYNLNIDFIEKMAILRFFHGFICGNFDGTDATFFHGLTNQVDVFLIQ